MNPFERVHELIISGKVIGPDGSWVSRTEALKEKRAFLQHVLSGEVYVNGAWTPLSEVNTSAPPPAPPPIRHEYEKETAVMPPPDHEALRNTRQTIPVRPPAATPPPLPEAPPIELLPPVAAPEPESAADHLHSEDLPFFRRPVDSTDDPAQPLQHKAIADSILSRAPLPQTDDAASPAISNDTGDTRESFAVQPVKDEPVVHPAPVPVPSKKSDSNPAKNVSPLAKLDKLDDAKKTETNGLSDKNAVTIRTISLGKGASLTISETSAAGTLVAVCSVEGFIDQSNSDTFHLQLMSMLEFGVRFFIINFERTVLVGSAGWGALAVAARMVKMSGGRLLICSMRPEIAGSFRLLQFNDVIDARPALPDCIATIREVIESQPEGAVLSDESTAAGGRYDESFAELPLPEKIRSVISRHGPLSLFQIAAHLKGAQYGNVKIGPLKLYLVLKDLNLESHWKRVRYYRSC